MDGTRFPTCRRAIPPGVSWKDAEELLSAAADGVASDPARLERAAALGLPPYIFDLARIEEAAAAAAGAAGFRNLPASTCVNPSLSLLELEWSRLPERIGTAAPDGNDPPVPGPERVFVWKEPATGAVRVSRAPDESLLALKIVAEGLDPLEVARHGGVPVGRIDAAVDDAVDRGILLRPPSRIRREGPAFPAESWPEEFLVSPMFTLQWHVTQQCDLSCLHCYDRTSRSPLAPEAGSAILRDLRAFCRERFVRGQVSFTGGNPFLYEHFETLYREAADLGLELAILGNPVPRSRLDRVQAVRRPAYFQVSLEGLPDHNDRIRGDGNFRAVTEFLGLLRECGIFSVVMLTLTEGNVDQVLPLAELLAGKADRFTFNRLSSAGRGSDLAPVGREKYEAFLRSYLDEAGNNPVLGRKDNLLNLVHYQRGEPPFGGCTGFGCGAAFNFVSLLPDGEVHACRKFPSPIGRIGRQTLSEIYDSPEARRYRGGAKSCEGCAIRPVCGGCLAVAWSLGRDVFAEADPYCFRNR